MFVKCFLAAALVFTACSASPAGIGGRITEGQDAIPGEFPYQVSVHWGLPPLIKYSHICGGSIISENYVLTAGHCIMKLGKMKVLAGKYYLTKAEETEQEVAVEKAIVHSGYDGGVAQHDIALLKLASPLVFNKVVAPVGLPKQGQVQKGEAVLSGWGSTSKKIIPKLPTILQKAEVPIVDNEQCLNELLKLNPTGSAPELFETQVCSGSKGEEISACSGDSGGPLAQYVRGKYVQVGIVSWGLMPCGASNAPSVYTRVASYVDWIQVQTKY